MYAYENEEGDSDDYHDDDDDYDYDSEEYLHHHGGYDDLYDDVQDDYGYDAWSLVEELEVPRKFCDYHPSWKKTKNTFLDLYVVVERTKQLFDLSRKYFNDTLHFDAEKLEEMSTCYNHLEKHLGVSKEKSIAMLSRVIGLPDLVIDKIFISIVESYNWHFDQFGPEEVSWQYEEGHSEEDQKYLECHYNAIGYFYERILASVRPSMMHQFGFNVDLRSNISELGLSVDGLNGLDVNSDTDSVDG